LKVIILRTFLVGWLAILLMALSAHADESVGAKFGSRDPRICATRTEALSAATAKQYFICDSEFTVGPNASGESIYLVSDVTVQLGKPRPFSPDTDTFGFAADNSIDPSQPVVPIRGSFNEWVCGKLGQINAAPGKSCNLTSNPHAVGICFKNSFGDWHCTMTDLAGVREFLPLHAPPTQP
jgi:hypothetical protein